MYLYSKVNIYVLFIYTFNKKNEVKMAPSISEDPTSTVVKPDVKDLFSAHDFDIQIDLPSTSKGKWTTAKLYTIECIVTVLVHMH